MHRHAELLLVVDGESDRLHLARIVRVRLEVEQARALAVVEEAFAIDLARVARDGEVNVLASGLREVHALKRARRPVGLVARLSAVMVLDQRELDLAGIVGLADGPVAAVDFGGAILDYEHDHAGCENQVGQGATHSHINLLFDNSCD